MSRRFVLGATSGSSSTTVTPAAFTPSDLSLAPHPLKPSTAPKGQGRGKQHNELARHLSVIRAWASGLWIPVAHSVLYSDQLRRKERKRPFMRWRCACKSLPIWLFTLSRNWQRQ
jgi:hypothetical protein